MPYTSPFSDVDIPPVDVWAMYMDHPRDFPVDHTILVDGDTNRSYTFAQMRSLSAEFGRGLRHEFGWQKGDVLAFFAPNNIDTAVTNLGAIWAGGIVSPANPTYTPEELAGQLVDSRAKALVTHKAFLQTACRGAELAGLKKENILLLGDERDDTGRFRHWTEVTDKEAWLKAKRPTIDPQKDLAYLAYSSGTTGLPKGVMLTHYNMVANACQFSKFDVKMLSWEMDAQLGILPFFHIYGLGIVLNLSLISGAKCVVMAKFDLEKACKLIQDHRLTFMYVPPPVVLALGKHPLVSQYDLSSLRFINSGAAPLSQDLVDSVFERLGVMVKQGYGLTETSPAVTSQLIDEWKRYLGSIGKLMPNMQAKIVDAEGKELPPNESGELLLKGPNVFGGYWNKPELNKETFTEDGWFKTGDVMYIDPSGNLYVTDRIKELIKYKGYQVPPAELEAKLIGRQDIADVCVIGVWNEDEQTEVPRAYVVPSPGVDGSDELAAEITQWLSSRVGPPKRLRGGVRFTKEIPKSPSGKILRRVLRDRIKKDEEGTKSKL
ncbi:hypothetical protein FZEAL_1277 [Fusarium zealandicum]|uniref:4-coumarate-CoA ligase n=1 Tax=Fusarium zealandicum TaxID=1053134 RepID=A0A8H4UTK4_9HYPO|nr:hypothetical protein FZEAL_1277 [Fusarium zealandicum]